MHLLKSLLLKIALILVSILCVFYFMFATSLQGGIVMMKPSGGVGNQLFRYATAYSLAKKTDSKLYFLVSASEVQENLSPLDRNYVLDQFHIKPDKIIYDTSSIGGYIFKRFYKNRGVLNSIANVIMKVLRFVDHRIPSITIVTEMNILDLGAKKNNQILILRDDFESEIFFEEFKDDIRTLFGDYNLNEEKWQNTIEQISNKNAVCVHVRRGDIINAKISLSINYQKKAINLAKQVLDNPQFFIFSDSVDLVKKELAGISNIHYISGDNTTPMEDFVLMSKCGNNIVANSTFSWWAAYLNKSPNKLVIAPYDRYQNIAFYGLFKERKVRYEKKSLYRHFAYPKDWVLLEHDKPDLKDFAKTIISDKKQLDEIFKDYYEREFYIYTGDLRQLDLGLLRAEGTAIQDINKKLDNHVAPTVITAYYNVKSRASLSLYQKWANNFLRIPFNLVVYTDKENAGWIRKIRGDLPMILVEKNIGEFYHYRFLDKYKQFSKRDNQKKHSPELYMIWAEKIKFVNEVIKTNPYKSNFFVWCDIGIFRDDKLVRKGFPNNIKQMIHDKISFAQVKDFSIDEEVNKLMIGDNNARVAGGTQVGDAVSWRIYDALWDLTLKDLMDNDIPSGDDQRVIGTIALRYPTFINLLYSNLGFSGDRWRYSLSYYADDK